jgi:hypothetical protein
MSEENNNAREELEKQKALYAIELERFLNNPKIPQSIKDKVTAHQNVLNYSSISLRGLAGQLLQEESQEQ